VLPMGWKQSPPSFCITTETAADVANEQLHNNSHITTPHRLDQLSETLPLTTTIPQPALLPTRERHLNSQHHLPVHCWDVHVDNFIGLAQGNKWKRRRTKRILLHALDSVLRKLNDSDNPHRQEPASEKKLKQGDICWATKKLVLGWLVDTVEQTTKLPPHRQQRLRQMFDGIKPGQKRMATKQWHKTLGELRSMALAIPGAQGLFSTLQHAFTQPERQGCRLRLTSAVHDFIQDFRWLTNELASRPTNVAETVPHHNPSTRGACDAPGKGMGGVHFFCNNHGQLCPLFWRAKFPNRVQSKLVSHNNPQGKMSNSDLELAGSLVHVDVLAQHADVASHTVHNCHDNTPTLCWLRKGSTATTGPAAYLLRLHALHQRQCALLHDCIKGTANLMANVCSRA